jgi:hypothetical protein
MRAKAKPEITGFSFLRHEEEDKPDFSGWATKAGLKCSDGRTIMPDAFKHQDKETVPLVWQHNHDEPANVLGYAVLEHRNEGVYAYGYFNDTEAAKHARTLVTHKDIKSLSIYANQLTEKSKQVFHGFIRELSLVLSGANPGALIDNITLAHSDGELVTLEDEAIIYTGLELEHADGTSSGGGDGPTVQEIYDSMTPEQQDVVAYMVSTALDAAGKNLSQSSDDDEKKKEEDKKREDAKKALAHADDHKDDEEGKRMTRNVFEQQNGGKKEEKHVLTHDAIKGIVEDAHRMGSLKEAVEAYALKHGIDNIDILFPDARNVTDTPEFDARRVEWVAGVINGTKHSPFSRIKSLVADITFDDARAKGYIKGNLKKEEFFGVSRRVTTPSTIYKKQKLDRDDIIDITDFDVVAWLKAEMRLMLDEELARAVLVGDGRDVADEDKIRDPMGAAEGAGIRSIANDHDLYAATVTVDDSALPVDVVDQIISAMGYYKGSGSPTFFTTLPTLTTMLLSRNPQTGNRYWRTPAELASEMGVDKIVTVEVMEGEADLIGIIVNLKDYTIGADKGGDVNFFDDFDIDYNQYKYLLETRVSGALTKIRSAVVIRRAAAGGTLAAPAAPTFDDTTNVVTVPATTGVQYVDQSDGTPLVAGAQPALAEGETLTVEARPTAGYYFSNNVNDQWTFENRA